MRVGIIFGGSSVEHTISVISARAIAAAFQERKHSCLCIGIGRDAHWYLLDEVVSPDPDPDPDPNPESNKTPPKRQRILLNPGGGNKEGLWLTEDKKYLPLDVAFPVLHGSFGEDGRIQGCLETCDIDYVGADLAASCLTNDKDITKRILNEAGVPTPKHLAYRQDSPLAQALATKDQQQLKTHFQEISNQLKLPFWIKPANLGSSIGMTQVKEEGDFVAGLSEAFGLDRKIVIEEHISGRELESAVLQDASGLTMTPPGEVVLGDAYTFYDYDAKYAKESTAEIVVPADVSDKVVQQVKEVAAKVFTLLECKNIMRLDLFLVDDKLMVNEVQTIPGFTSISMYPKLLDNEGIPLPELVERLAKTAASGK